MPRINTKNLGPTTIAPLVASLACLGLAACGSSSGGSSSSASTPTAAHTTAEATSTTPTTATTTTPASTTPTSSTPTSTTHEPAITTHKQFVAMIECLRHNGIKLPPTRPIAKAKDYKNTPPVDTNTPQFQAAKTKCQHTVLGAGGSESAGGESAGGGSG